jgi:hypothetical protein
MDRKQGAPTVGGNDLVTGQTLSERGELIKIQEGIN